MKVTVDAKELISILKATTCETSHIPVLGFAKLIADVDGIRVQGTDLELSTTHQLAGTIHEGGEILIPHKSTIAVLAGESCAITIKSLEDNWVKLTVDAADTYKLAGAALANFPQIPAITESKEFATIASSTLRTLLTRAAFAISREQSRNALNGAHLKVSRDRFRVTATDGVRLSTTSDIGDYAGDDVTLIPSDAVVWLRANLPSEGEVRILTGEDHVHFVAPSASFSTRNLKGQFPNWEAVLPRDLETRVHVTLNDPAAVVKSLGRLAKVTDARSGASRWTINGRVQVSASSVNVGEATVTLSAHSDSHETETIVGLNLGYVSEFLKLSQESKQTTPVLMTVKDRQTSVHFTPAGLSDKGQTWDYVLMPVV